MSQPLEEEICLMVKEETGEVIGAFFNSGNAESYIRNNKGAPVAISATRLLDRSVMTIAMANVELAVANMEKKAVVVEKRYERVIKEIERAKKDKTLVVMRREVPALDKFLTAMETALS